MKTDFCVIGGGIAGLSIAAEISKKASVVVLEREQDIAYHTSGRSAALYSELSAESTALSLSKLTRPFLLNPPVGFSQYPLHNPITCIFTARKNELELIQSNAAKLDNPITLDNGQMLEKIPVLKTGGDGIVAGLLEEDAFRIDVGALVQGFRAMVKHGGGTVQCNAEVSALTKDSDGWKVETCKGESLSSEYIVNAAGSWGDVIATLAGVAPLGLKPLRRNIIIFDGPENTDLSKWPAMASISGEYYFLPEAGKLMGSSADEIPSEPCDAQPEEYDIALAAHNIENVTTLEIKQIHHKWAGLRTFAPDRQVVAGYDANREGFFWFVGQGGFGMQTSAASARAAALLALGESLPKEYEDAGVTAEVLSPLRFTTQ
jgi:D-arginine dehydrogenase